MDKPWLIGALGSILGFLAQHVFSRLTRETNETSNDVHRLELIITELKVLVTRLDADVKELWRLKNDVHLAWTEIRRIRGSDSEIPS